MHGNRRLKSRSLQQKLDMKEECLDLDVREIGQRTGEKEEHCEIFSG